MAANHPTDLKMAVYAAMIDRMDQAIGRVFAKVKEIGKWKNTLILFLADNGGCPETPDTTSFRPKPLVVGSKNKKSRKIFYSFLNKHL